ncbi:plastid division protein PDV2-like [Typha latifolia]|uniref:plastid division protein PDV2-like n=1 Tax=Typha latifolia TaxID=4733 RepID=UPI003C2F9BA6
MEGEGIGLVLARASELRSKIADCIDRNGAKRDEEEEEEEEEEGGGGGGGGDEDAESLLGIQDALESLEQQLSALQALQEQQMYERETILNQIDCGRRLLLNKLRVYKGEKWEVIHEAMAFASETVDYDEGLVLPPYPGPLLNSFVLDDLYPSSNNAPRYKLCRNGATAASIHEMKSTNGPEKGPNLFPSNSNTPRGIRSVIGLVARSVITFVSVISILGLAGYKPVLRRSAIKFEAPSLFNKPAGDRRHVSVQCPPGKILVIEDGNTMCLVKERVEIPFESDVTVPNVSYGFG